MSLKQYWAGVKAGLRPPPAKRTKRPEVRKSNMSTARPYRDVDSKILRMQLNEIEKRVWAAVNNAPGVQPGNYPQQYWDIRSELTFRGWPLSAPGRAIWEPAKPQFPEGPADSTYPSRPFRSEEHFRPIIYARQKMEWPPKNGQEVAAELGWPAGDTLEAKLAKIGARRRRVRPQVKPLVPLPAKPKPRAPRPTPEQENPPRKFDFDAEDI